MSSFAILRTAKLKSFGEIAGSGAHTWRERSTPNADPSRFALNESSGAGSSSELIDAVKERLKDKTVRSNSVICIEYLMTASPETINTWSKEKQDQFFSDSVEWLKEQHGAENIVSWSIHRDETTPHLVAYVVPVTKDGRLSARDFLGGKKMLADMQTSYAQSVEKLGLKRGLNGSKSKHKSVQKFYAEIESALRERKIPITEIEKIKTIFRGEVVKLEDHESSVKRLESMLKKALTQRDVLSALTNQLREKEKGRDEALDKLRATATQMRSLDLVEVLERMGCVSRQYRHGDLEWDTAMGRLSIDKDNRAKFYFHDQYKGGGGAIDLVMMHEGLDYKQAVSWLSDRFGAGAVIADAAETVRQITREKVEEKPYQLPAESRENWQKVRDYLTKKRGLDERIIDDLHAENRVFASQNGRFVNAIFPYNSGKGHDERGVGDSTYKGSKGKKTGFTLKPSDETESKKLALVESIIDALSLRQIGFKGWITAICGNVPSLIEKIKKQADEKGMTLFAAFDTDSKGEKYAEISGGERLKPQWGKDWNEMLTTKEPQIMKDIETKDLNRSNDINIMR